MTTSTTTPRITIRAFTLAALAGLPAAATAQQTFIDYIGPAVSNWSSPFVWQGNNVPNVAGEVPLLHGHVRVTLDMHILVDKIGMDHPLSTIAINNGQILGIQSMTDGLGTTGLFGGGRYEINGTAHGTYIRLYGPADSWAIFGSIVEPDPSVMILSASGTAIVDASVANSMLYNEGRIEGAGSLGANSLRIRNNGVIAATHPASLTLDAPSGGNTNSGDLRAEGGVLTLLNGAFDNTGGTITLSALPNSLVDLNGVTVTGGELRAEPGATGLTRGFNGSHFIDCTFSGPLQIPNAHVIFLDGSPTVGPDGVLSLAGSAHGTYIRLANSLTLTGAGRVRSSNTQNNIIDASVSNQVLTNDLAGGISGSMQLGANSLAIVNNTYIAAEGSSGMTIDPPAAGFVNNGALWARTDATLLLQNGTFTNPGSFNAETGGLVNVTGCNVIGGTFSTAPGGLIQTYGSTTLSNVSLTPGAALNVPNANLTHLQDSIINAGTMTLSATGHATYFRTSGNLVLSGPGQISASNTQLNIIDASLTNQTLTNNSTIRGSMQLCANSLAMVNNGLVEAVGSNGMTIDPPSGGFVNSGLIRCAPASFITIQNGTLTNTEGELESAQTINFTGLHLIGGILRGTGGVFSSYGNSVLQDVTIDGSLAVPNSQLTHLNNTITNNGAMQLNASAHATYFRINTAEVTLSGAGEVVCSNTLNNVIDCSVTGQKLINNQTIRGGVQLTQNALHLVNNGLVEAQGTAGILIDPPGSYPVDNNAILRAAPGSVLTIQNGAVDNTGGLIESSSLINFIGATINGGTLRSTGGTFSSGANSILNNLTIDGALSVPNSNLTFLQGTITNSGAMALNATAHATYFRSLGNATLTGAGTLDFSNTLNNVMDASVTGEVLTIEGVTLRGSVQLGQNSLAVINRGTILSTQSSGITIDPPAGVTGFTNDDGGTLAATTGNITVNAGNFTNAGTFNIDTGRTVNRSTGSVTQTAGQTIVNGQLICGAAFLLQGGRLGGTGLLSGSVNNSGGTLAPGATGADTTGTLTITGAYTQGSGATMEVQLGGLPAGDWDVTSVTGAATLGGTVHVRFEGGFAPALGTTFRVLNAASRTGTFSSISSEGAPGLTVNAVYDTTGVTLVVVQACGTSDFNGDGDFGTDADIEAFFACLGGTCCDTCFPSGSDFNADGDFGTDADIEAFFRVLGGAPC